MESIIILFASLQDTLHAMTFTDWLEVGFTLTAVVGNEFVVRRDHRGYYFWLVANVAGMALFLSLHRYGACMLYAYYTWSCFRGLRNWQQLLKKPETQHA